MGGAIDALERAGAVQGMKPPAGPSGLRPDHAVHFLRIAVQIETHDFRESDPGTVTCAAILHRPPQPALPPHECARRARAVLVHQDRICLMRLPGSAQMRGVEDRQRVGERACAVVRRREHPQSSGVLHDGGVARRNSGQQVGFLHPSVGKPLRPVERDRRIGGAFRNHPDLPVAPEHERIGEVPRLLEDDARRPARTGIAERHDRDHALVGAVIEILDEDVEAPLMDEGKRVGIKMRTGIGQYLP